MSGKLMLFYPPGKLFQRSEARCQSNIEKSTATSVRACNDLGYCAAVMRQHHWEVHLKDYQSENCTLEDLYSDFQMFMPNAVLLATTNATLFDDLEIIAELKVLRSDLLVVMTGAVFFAPPSELLKNKLLANVDFLICEEVECVIDQILNGCNPVEIPRIYYRESGQWKKSQSDYLEENLDRLPFPARDLMNNTLYVRPDTGEMQATISTSRGCPSQCTFCLTPVMTGRKVRFRSPENIVAEIKECVEKYHIYNFFFRADTFTINRKITLEICRLLQQEGLADKIHWVANSRVDTLDDEILQSMKACGCWLLAIGFESGSEETLQRIKKRITVEQMQKTANAIHKAGIKLFGFFMIGFPWESKEHLKATERCIWKLAPDFLELHIVTPFYGTALYNEIAASRGDLLNVAGCDYFEKTFDGINDFMSVDKIASFRRRVLLRYLLRPRYLIKRLIECMTDYRKLFSYWNYGLRMLFNLCKKS